MNINSFCLPITFKCNWFCDYCVADTHNKKDIKIEDVIDLVENVISIGSEVTITGGEPGLVNKDNMDLIFKNLIKKECLIDITTNGLFIENYPEYYNILTGYLYHCSDKLDNIVKIFDDPDNKIEYIIVVDDNNINNLKNFLENNSNIYIKINAAYNLNNNKTRLSKKNVLKILKEFKHYIKKEDLKNLILNYNDLNDSIKL